MKEITNQQKQHDIQHTQLLFFYSYDKQTLLETIRLLRKRKCCASEGMLLSDKSKCALCVNKYENRAKPKQFIKMLNQSNNTKQISLLLVDYFFLGELFYDSLQLT